MSWTVCFVAIFCVRLSYQCQPKSVSLYSEEWNSAVAALTQEMNSKFKASQTPDADLYDTFTTMFNISKSEEGRMRFSAALDRIAKAFYGACFGEEDDKLIVDEQYPLHLFLLLLKDHVTFNSLLLQETYGKLLCLEHTAASDSDTEEQADCGAQLSVLHECIDQKNLVCLFDLDPSLNCASPRSRMKTINCVAFFIATPQGDSEMFNTMKKMVLNYINGSIEREHEVSCFTLQEEKSKLYCTKSQFVSVYDSEESQIRLYSASDLLEDIELLNSSNVLRNNSGLLRVVQFLSSLFTDEAVIHSHIVIFGNHHQYEVDSSIIEAARDSGMSVSFFQNDTDYGGVINLDYELIAKETNGVAITGNSNDFNMMMKFITTFPLAIDSERVIYLFDSHCRAFNLSLFVQSFSCLVRTSQPEITIENPLGIALALPTVAKRFVIYEDLNAIKGEWKVCVTGDLFELSVAQELDFEFSISFLSPEMVSTTNPFACDVQTFVLSAKYQSYISLTDLHLNIVNNRQKHTILQTTLIKECNGVLYGSIMLPSHSDFHYQLCGFDTKGNYFSHLDTGSVVELQYPHIQFWLVGSPTILLNPGARVLVRIMIRNTSKGPQKLPLLIEAIAGQGINVSFVNGNEIILQPHKDYEFHLYLLTSETLPVGLDFSSFVKFSVNSECIQKELTHVFQTISQKKVDMSITNISQTSLDLQWNEPDLSSPVSSYFISFDFTNGTKDTLSFDHDIFRCSVNGLSPNQLIYVGMIATTTIQNEFAGFTPRPIRTQESVPKAISLITAKLLNAEAASVTWIRQDYNGNILSYRISVYAENGYKETISVNASVYNYNFTELRKLTVFDTYHPP